MKSGNLEPLKYLPVGSRFYVRYPDGHIQIAMVTLPFLEGREPKAQWQIIENAATITQPFPIMDLIIDWGQVLTKEKYPYICSFAD